MRKAPVSNFVKLPAITVSELVDSLEIAFQDKKPYRVAAFAADYLNGEDTGSVKKDTYFSKILKLNAMQGDKLDAKAADELITLPFLPRELSALMTVLGTPAQTDEKLEQHIERFCLNQEKAHHQHEERAQAVVLLGRAVEHGIRRKAAFFIKSRCESPGVDLRKANNPIIAFADFVSGRHKVEILETVILKIIKAAHSHEKNGSRSTSLPTPMQMIAIMSSLDFPPPLKDRTEILEWPPERVNGLIKDFHAQEMRRDAPPALSKPAGKHTKRLQESARKIGETIDIPRFARMVRDWMDAKNRTPEWIGMALQGEGIKSPTGNSRDNPAYCESLVLRLLTAARANGHGSTTTNGKRVRAEEQKNQIEKWDNRIFQTLQDLCDIKELPLKQRTPA